MREIIWQILDVNMEIIGNMEVYFRFPLYFEWFIDLNEDDFPYAKEIEEEFQLNILYQIGETERLR